MCKRIKQCSAGLELLAGRDLLKGKAIGIDTTTLEANEALHLSVRRDTREFKFSGTDYQRHCADNPAPKAKQPDSREPH
jgi:hypothetical protein